jgi:hypothetical protein
MDRETFTELRQIAARKRDAAIQSARDDYKKSIAEIACLEHHLIGEIKAQRPADKKQLKLQVLTCEILPGDCGFSIDDASGSCAAT